jgi:hypothetical protein
MYVTGHTEGVTCRDSVVCQTGIRFMYVTGHTEGVTCRDSLSTFSGGVAV